MAHTDPSPIWLGMLVSYQASIAMSIRRALRVSPVDFDVGQPNLSWADSYGFEIQSPTWHDLGNPGYFAERDAWYIGEPCPCVYCWSRAVDVEFGWTAPAFGTRDAFRHDWYPIIGE